MFGCLAHLGVLKILFFFECPGVSNCCHQESELLADDLVNLGVVMLLDCLSVCLLELDEVTHELVGLTSLGHGEGPLSLHLVERLVDIHEAAQEGRPCLDQIAS